MQATRVEVESVQERTERALRAVEGAHEQAEAALAASERARGEAEVGRAIAEAAQRAAQAARDAALEGRAAAEAATREAELARRDLQNFLAMAAHDIRTPLTAILGVAQLLARPNVSAEMRDRGIASIRTSALRMDRLIQDIVDAGCVGAGSFQLRVKATDLVALVEQVADTQRRTSDRHRIVVDAPDRLDGEWDADRVSQVLANQVANAIKYSPRGGDVAITVRREGDQAVVSISDRGIGIRAEDLALLFQPFSRLYTEERASGAGLGLYISRGIVRAHGGRIEAASQGLGEGSTFTVTLPLGRPA